MLVGDTFSHSSSIDGIASAQRGIDTADIATIDRSTHEE